MRTRHFLVSIALAPGEKPKVLEPGSLLVWADGYELLRVRVPLVSRMVVALVAEKMLAGAAAEPARAQALGVVAIALWGVPVTFTAAVVTMLALWEVARAFHFDLGVVVEKHFPLQQGIGGDRAVFLGVFLVYEAAVLAWAIVRNARRGVSPA